MAKKSQIAREKHRQVLVDQYQEQREELRRRGDSAGLSRLPKNSNPVRLHNRCAGQRPVRAATCAALGCRASCSARRNDP